MRQTTTPASPGELQKVVSLCDDFAEFDAYCAFFCDATAALCRNREEWLDDTSAEGLTLFSQWLKGRSRALKRDLKVVWESSGHEPLN